jgi:hypothetical protein
MKLIYVAGPFRGPNSWVIECNVREAETMALEVARMGAVPLCPHSMTRFFQGTLPDEYWLEATLEMLRKCDAVVFTARWSQSAGARAENEEAKRLGLPRFFADHGLTALENWLQGDRSTSWVASDQVALSR